MSASFKPGTYVKGDQARVCETPADAVAAAFDGFKLAEETPAEQVEVAPEDQDPTPTPEAVESHDVFADVDDEDPSDEDYASHHVSN